MRGPATSSKGTKRLEYNTGRRVDEQQKRKRPTKKARVRRLGKAKALQGRQLYVTGECRTHAEVAETLGCHASSVSMTAAAEDWGRLRDEHRARIEKRALRDSEKAMAKAITRTTKTAWAAAALAVQSLARRLERGELVPRPSEVESITRTALALSGHVVDDGRELDELEKLSLLEITERSIRQIEQGLGAS